MSNTTYLTKISKQAWHFSIFGYNVTVIESFADKETAKIASGEVSGKLPRDIQEGARMKLTLLNGIAKIEDLWGFPSLKAKRVGGGWSIRINDQWRVTFFWEAATAKATQVRIVDYH